MMDRNRVPNLRRLFLIVPAYNEADGIGSLLAALAATGEAGLYAVIVDDGSRDDTFGAVERAATRCSFPVDALRLSRNFGQQAALHAGLEYAFTHANREDAFLLMDADLQHPPSAIPAIRARLDAGCDHIQMVRADAATVSWTKRFSSRLFYRVFRFFSGLSLPEGAADFRALSFRFVQAYLQLSERGRFNRGLFYWLGFRTEFLPYQCAERAHGQTHYSAGRMLRLGLSSLLQFSSRPLISICAANVAFCFLFCLGYLVYEAIRFHQGVQFVVGWPSLMFLVSFWSASLALSQLLMALYIDRLFHEAKGRPIYVIQETWSKGNR